LKAVKDFDDGWEKKRFLVLSGIYFEYKNPFA